MLKGEILDRLEARLDSILPVYGRFGKRPPRKELLVARYFWRNERRTRIEISGTEPASKKMRPRQRLALQQQLVAWLDRNHRRAFTGPIAMRLSVTTSSKNPPTAYTIAKNLLDLFCKPEPGLETKRRRLLYNDDSQIQALSVNCSHGGASSDPEILVELWPMRDFIDDLSLLAYFWDKADNFSDDSNEDYFLNEVRRQHLNDGKYWTPTYCH